MKLKETIGSNLKRCREQAGFSQVEVARVISVSRASIANMEAGRQAVSLKWLFAFSYLYNAPINLFFEGVEVTDSILPAETREVLQRNHPKSYRSATITLILDTIDAN